MRRSVFRLRRNKQDEHTGRKLCHDSQIAYADGAALPTPPPMPNWWLASSGFRSRPG